MKSELVVILGASNKPERYSYKAFKLLAQYGHKSILVHPNLTEIEGEACFPDLKAVASQNFTIDTLTMYVNPDLSSVMAQDILNLKPKRVIFNPGTENPELMELLKKNDIPYEETCTLVLLKTGQFC